MANAAPRVWCCMPRLNSMKVSVIVVNYNGRELVKTCLESIFRQRTFFEYEVIVVDNASSDGSREGILFQFPKVRLIANKSNFGFSRANNQAIRQSSSPYILLLNNDAHLVGEDFLEKACAFMEKRKDCAAIGPDIISPDRKVQNPYYKSYPSLTTEFLSLGGLLPIYNFFNRDKYFYTREGLAYYQKDSRETIVSHLCGACILVRRKGVEDAGLLDERMFFYHEDLDLCFRLRKNGWKIFVLPDITAVHVGTGSWEKVPFSVTGEATKSRYLFFKKNYGRRQYLYIRLVHFATSFIRILIYPVLRLLGKSSPKARSFYIDIFRYSLMGMK